MPVTPQENETYRTFVSQKAQELGCFNFKPDDIVWHYTDGPGFLGILQSATLYATQVASLNDMNETKYATGVFQNSVTKLLEEKKDDVTARVFLQRVLDIVRENPATPGHATSKFFVTCFSGEEDDLTQWDRYGNKNGYAIGFYARGLYREPTSTLYKVVYDKQQVEKTSEDIAKATLNFFMEGLSGERIQNPDTWADEFFHAWDEWIYRLAPLIKDPNWKKENEFRIVHELKYEEFGQVRFKQKNTMLARYLPLSTPQWVRRRVSLLPVARIIIGPGNHPAVTRASVLLLLEQMGYANVAVEVTQVALQRP